MKNVFFYFMLLTFSIFISCTSSEDDTIKAADSKILSKDSQTISFSDVLELSTDEQRILFRYVNPNKRKELWLSKITHLKNNAVKKEEIKLIEFVENYIQNFSFDRALTDEEYNLIENDLLSLAKDANWSFSELIEAFGSLNIEEKSKTFQNSKKLKELIVDYNNKSLECNCRWGWCGSGDDCESASCNESDMGCGFLFLGACTDRCGGLPPGHNQ